MMRQKLCQNKFDNHLFDNDADDDGDDGDADDATDDATEKVLIIIVAGSLPSS